MYALRWSGGGGTLWHWRESRWIKMKGDVRKSESGRVFVLFCFCTLWKPAKSFCHGVSQRGFNEF